MSDENYRSLSNQLDSFREDLDARLDIMKAKMIPSTWMIASVLVPLSAFTLAFLGACAVVLFK